MEVLINRVKKLAEESQEFNKELEGLLEKYERERGEGEKEENLPSVEATSPTLIENMSSSESNPDGHKSRRTERFADIKVQKPNPDKGSNDHRSYYALERLTKQDWDRYLINHKKGFLSQSKNTYIGITPNRYRHISAKRASNRVYIRPINQQARTGTALSIKYSRRESGLFGHSTHSNLNLMLNERGELKVVLENTEDLVIDLSAEICKVDAMNYNKSNFFRDVAKVDSTKILTIDKGQLVMFELDQRLLLGFQIVLSESMNINTFGGSVYGNSMKVNLPGLKSKKTLPKIDRIKEYIDALALKANSSKQVILPDVKVHTFELFKMKTLLTLSLEGDIHKLVGFIDIFKISDKTKITANGWEWTAISSIANYVLVGGISQDKTTSRLLLMDDHLRILDEAKYPSVDSLPPHIFFVSDQISTPTAFSTALSFVIIDTQDNITTYSIYGSRLIKFTTEVKNRQELYRPQQAAQSEQAELPLYGGNYNPFFGLAPHRGLFAVNDDNLQYGDDSDPEEIIGEPMEYIE